MPSTIATIGLTYDGTDIQQAPPFGIHLELVNGLMGPSEVRGVDTVVPALAGQIWRNRQPHLWRPELRGWVAGIGSQGLTARAHFAGLRQTLRTLFDPTRDPADLVAYLEDGSVATISCRPLPTPLWDQVVPELARVSYELLAVEDWVIVPAGS